MIKNKTSPEILKLLFKDFTIKQTITSLANEIRLSRVGVWKVLKKLEKEQIIILSPVGSGKTSTYSISLNWENPLVEKNLALTLTEDAIKQQRWLTNFAEIESKVDFLIIYGSIVYSPKEANDIDLLVSEEVYAKLRQKGWQELHKSPNDIPLVQDVFEAHENWNFSPYSPTLEHLLGTVTVIDGVPFASLQEVRKWKAASGRSKDLADIELIDRYLAKKG